MGKVILIASGKGGTGKTLFAANIGTLLALRNKNVVLIDMDLGLRNLDLYLGLENKVVYNIMDVLSGGGCPRFGDSGYRSRLAYRR